MCGTVANADCTSSHVCVLFVHVCFWSLICAQFCARGYVVSYTIYQQFWVLIFSSLSQMFLLRAVNECGTYSSDHFAQVSLIFCKWNIIGVFFTRKYYDSLSQNFMFNSVCFFLTLTFTRNFWVKIINNYIFFFAKKAAKNY